MGDFSKFVTKAFVRKWLAALGGTLLTYGYLTDSEAKGFVDSYLEEVVGLALLAGSHGWEYVYQRYVKTKVVTALALPKGSTPAELERKLEEKKEVG